jgi:hypothetical protein
VSPLKDRSLILYKTIIVGYSKNHTKPINTINTLHSKCEKSLYVEPDSTCNYICAVAVKTRKSDALRADVSPREGTVV